MNKDFEKILEEAGFVLVDGEIDHSITYTTENLRPVLEKISEMFNECMTETQKITAQLENMADHESDEYKQLSDYLVRINESSASIRLLMDKITAPL